MMPCQKSKSRSRTRKRPVRYTPSAANSQAPSQTPPGRPEPSLMDTNEALGSMATVTNDHITLLQALGAIPDLEKVQPASDPQTPVSNSLKHNQMLRQTMISQFVKRSPSESTPWLHKPRKRHQAPKTCF